MGDPERFMLTMEMQEGYRFAVDFDQPGLPPLVMDEPAPLGQGDGPNAARLLAAAVGHCLSASALYCLRRAHVGVSGMRSTVETTLARNDSGRLRIGQIRVHLEPQVADTEMPRIGRCLELFEDFCVVTASVRQGIDVVVDVDPVSVAST